MKKGLLYQAFRVIIILILFVSIGLYAYFVFVYIQVNVRSNCQYFPIWERIAQKDVLSTTLTLVGSLVATAYTLIHDRAETKKEERDKITSVGCYFLQFGTISVEYPEIKRDSQQIRVIESDESYDGKIPFMKTAITFVTTKPKPKMVKTPLAFTDEYFSKTFLKRCEKELRVNKYIEYFQNVHYATVPVMGAVPLSYLGSSNKEQQKYITDQTAPFVIPKSEKMEIGKEYEKIIWFCMYGDNDYLTFIKTKLLIKPKRNGDCDCTLMQETPYYLIGNKLKVMAY